MEWRISIVLLLFALADVAAVSQPISPLAGCPPECPADCDDSHLTDCEDTIIDECGCCPVCVRKEGEECGERGTCDHPLQCRPANLTYASCTKPSLSICATTPCPVVFHPRCSSDSLLTIDGPVEGECCAGPGRCTCDYSKCTVPECGKGEHRFIVKHGKGIAGECCDAYECGATDAHCATVRCPAEPLRETLDMLQNDGEDACPSDSVRPPVHTPKGTCCPIKPGCRCRPSVCKPAQCPEGKFIKVQRRGNGSPGSCCDQWTCEDMEKTCVRGGKRYADDEEWQESSCEMCKCKRGVAACSQMKCPNTNSRCSWIITVSGECCPVCAGCQTEKGEKKRVNETWQKDDCTSCTCSENGEATCKKYMCRSDCENPRKVEGQCCPVCDEPTILTLPSTCPSLEHCPLRCENGLRRDDRGCFVCECLPSATSSSTAAQECTPLKEENCEKQCAHGYMRDASGCAVCKCAKCPPLHQCMKHCLYGFETNSAGCPVCKCRAMARIDARLTVGDKSGRVVGKDRCVSVLHSGKVLERDGGEWWNDGCRHCFCEGQQEFCSLISCAERPKECPEEHWVQSGDSCCATCTVPLPSTPSPSSSSLSVKHEHTVCQSPGTGRMFTDGETWQLAPCVSCTCRVGHVLCRVAECPPTPCDQPLIDPHNHCCPRCPTNASSTALASASAICTDESGTVHAAGSAWREDDCTSCTCAGGKIACFHEHCEELKTCRGVPLVLKGRCCPVCSDVLSSDAVCTVGNAVYAVKEEWRDGACKNCSCVAGGQTRCLELVCPACADPVPIDGQCCPLCKDSAWAHFEGRPEGNVFASPSDELSPATIVGFTLCGVLFAVGLLVLAVVLWKRHEKKDKPDISLRSCNRVGSRPLLVDWETSTTASHPETHHHVERERRDSRGGHSDSLFSTSSSDCASTTDSSASSGHGTQSDSMHLMMSSRHRSPSPPLPSPSTSPRLTRYTPLHH